MTKSKCAVLVTIDQPTDGGFDPFSFRFVSPNDDNYRGPGRYQDAAFARPEPEDMDGPTSRTH